MVVNGLSDKNGYTVEAVTGKKYISFEEQEQKCTKTELITIKKTKLLEDQLLYYKCIKVNNFAEDHTVAVCKDEKQCLEICK